VVAKVRGKLAGNKQAAQRFDGERFNIRKLNQSEFTKQYQTEITKWFTVLENLSNDKNISRAW